MPSLVFRLLVLLLAVLLQVGSWRAGASSHTSADVLPPAALGDFDAPEDLSEQLSKLDDALENDVWVNTRVPGCSPVLVPDWQRTEHGLPSGGPPLDAPFKPPRG